MKALTPERMAKLDHFFLKFGGLTIVITLHAVLSYVRPVHRGHGPYELRQVRTLFNCIGGIAWVSLFVLVGYFFGGISIVQEHFEVIVLGIVAVSVAPAIIGAVKAAMNSKAEESERRGRITRGQPEVLAKNDGCGTRE